ncbi:MAG: hypothetical protein IPM47_05890 [Sphingobacteriales bacterium]|nr:MAG: hypothetical protein IPM47_05890 [Sphingobacteriales bacterium]
MKQAVVFIVILLLQSKAYTQSKYFEKLYKWEALQELRKVALFDNEMIFAGNAKPETGDWFGQIYVTNNNGDTLFVKSLTNLYGHIGFVDLVEKQQGCHKYKIRRSCFFFYIIDI